MSLSDFGMTVDDAKYILGSELHSDILEVLAYGMYTVIYCVALYLICMVSLVILLDVH